MGLIFVMVCSLNEIFMLFVVIYSLSLFFFFLFLQMIWLWKFWTDFGDLLENASCFSEKMLVLLFLFLFLIIGMLDWKLKLFELNSLLKHSQKDQNFGIEVSISSEI